MTGMQQSLDLIMTELDGSCRDLTEFFGSHQHRGTITDPGGCVIANYIRGRLSYAYSPAVCADLDISVTQNGILITHYKAVMAQRTMTASQLKFIRRFDNGNFDELRGTPRHIMIPPRHLEMAEA